MLMGFCLYDNDGQLIKPPTMTAPPPQAQVPLSPPPYQNLDDGSTNGGTCCPQPNPVNISITNSQDTNSRNTNTENRRFVRQKQRRPMVVKGRDRIVKVPVPTPPIIQRLVQRVPMVRTVIKEVPKEVIRQVEVPVVKDHYTERVVEVVVDPCKDTNYDYPEFP